MGFNDPGSWGGRTSRDRTLDKLVYDEVHKKGGGGNGGNSGCAVWLIFAVGLIVVVLLGSAC